MTKKNPRLISESEEKRIQELAKDFVKGWMRNAAPEDRKMVHFAFEQGYMMALVEERKLRQSND